MRPRCVRSLRYSNDLHFTGTEFVFSAICDSNFHEVITQFDGTTRRIFFDGVLKSSDTPSGTHASRNDNFCLGGEVARNTYGFIGQIRNVRIWDGAPNTGCPPPAPPAPPPCATPAIFEHASTETYTGSVDCSRGTIQSRATAADLPTGSEHFTVALEYSCSSSLTTSTTLYSWGAASSNSMNALHLTTTMFNHYWCV